MFHLGFHCYKPDNCVVLFKNDKSNYPFKGDLIFVKKYG